MPAYSIDPDRLAKFRELEGIATDAELARRMDVEPSTVSRVLSRQTGPSARFIAGLAQAFPGRDVMSLLTPSK